jgi:hypothetical protein
MRTNIVLDDNLINEALKLRLIWLSSGSIQDVVFPVYSTDG